MTKNICVFFICLYGQDIQVKLFLLVHIDPQVFVSECLALIRRKRCSISSVFLVHIDPQVSISECSAPIRRKRVGHCDAVVIFFRQSVCLFFIRLYGLDFQVKLFLLVHINPQVSVSEILAPIQQKR
ncbi:hypothetical protein M9H77_30093 [Catharanthus roseus]|uniref:Uncharacterized protein n=1 Tax=Catharanthus roseus TaxID=4058 RepID=A0ACC0A066_CATRO|nr:hypothetical protein M9H77_30093 [Catharanthus roseus]